MESLTRTKESNLTSQRRHGYGDTIVESRGIGVDEMKRRKNGGQQVERLFKVSADLFKKYKHFHRGHLQKKSFPTKFLIHLFI